jgi:hypothetical protein
MEYLSDTDELYVTSLCEIHRLLSARGEVRHLADLDVFDTEYQVENMLSNNKHNALKEIYQRTTSRVMERLAPRFTVQNVYKLPRIREIGTYTACYLITHRRGNEPLYEAEMLEGMDTLDDYKNGILYLDAPVTGTRVAMLSHVIDLRHHNQPSRIIRSASLFSGNIANPYINFFPWLV